MEITAQKSIASGIRGTMLGLVSFSFDAVPVGRPNAKKDESFKLLSPAFEPVSQRYINEAGDLFEQRDLVKGRLTDDDKWVAVTPEEVAAAKVGTLEANEITFTVHNAAEVAAATRPGEKAYRLRPSRNSKKNITDADANLYATIRELVDAQSGLVFIGALRLRDTRKVYRLEVWDGQLVLAELTCDEDLAERDVITGTVDEAMADQLGELAGLSVSPWDSSVHRWDVAAAVDELVAAKAGSPYIQKVPVAPVKDDDLMKVLAAAIAAKKQQEVAA